MSDSARLFCSYRKPKMGEQIEGSAVQDHRENRVGYALTTSSKNGLTNEPSRYRRSLSAARVPATDSHGDQVTAKPMSSIMKRSKPLASFLVVVATLIALATNARAATFTETFSGSGTAPDDSDQIAFTAQFTLNTTAQTLTIVLSDTGAPATDQADVLTALLFNGPSFTSGVATLTGESSWFMRATLPELSVRTGNIFLGMAWARQVFSTLARPEILMAATTRSSTARASEFCRRQPLRPTPFWTVLPRASMYRIPSLLPSAA